MILSLELKIAESRVSDLISDHNTPEAVFERQWALTMLDAVRETLREEYNTSGKSELYKSLGPYLTGDRNAPPYRETGDAMGMSESAIKMAVHRLRVRYRELLRLEIAQTVRSENEVDDEVRHLISVLQRNSS